MLPGIGQRVVKPNYRKCQTLSFCDGVPVPAVGKNGSKASSPAMDDDLHRFRPPHLVASRSLCFDGSSEHRERELAGLAPPVGRASLPKPFVPKTVLYDRLVLSFDGYYVEEGQQSWGFRSRAVHPIKLFYYLEDDTISVHEPITPNSGRPQGKLVYRHKVLKTAKYPGGDPHETISDKGPATYWHWKDLNVASDVTIFGRPYRLTDCNSWTREFLSSAGILVNAPEDKPESHPPAGQSNLLRARSAPPQQQQQRNHPLKKFLEHDGQILRFGCVWDRRDEVGIGPDERLKPYVLRFFLVDDTVQISDAEFERNQRQGLYGSGRSQEAILLRRQKLPKDPRPVLTSPADAADIVYYEPTDLLLGNVISVHGRRFILVETGDEFTRSFFRNLDIVDLSPIDISSL